MPRYRSLTTELLALNRKVDLLMRKIAAQLPDADELAVMKDADRLEQGNLSLNELVQIMETMDYRMQVYIACKAPESERERLWREYFNDEYYQLLTHIKGLLERRVA